jgi:hypothetical protein
MHGEGGIRVVYRDVLTVNAIDIQLASIIMILDDQP